MQLGTILERYSDTVVERVTSPVTGIQARCSFPPSIAEVVEACDAEHRNDNYAAEYAARSREQLRERQEHEREDDLEPLEHRRNVTTRILAAYQATLTPETKPQQWHWNRFSAEQLLATYRKDPDL